MKELEVVQKLYLDDFYYAMVTDRTGFGDSTNEWHVRIFMHDVIINRPGSTSNQVKYLRLSSLY